MAAVATALAVVSLRRFAGWQAGEWVVASGMLVLWLVFLFVIALVRRPLPRSALYLLDRAGGWKDCFSSAWEFLNQSNPTEAEQLHLQRAGALLSNAQAQVKTIFPAPAMGWGWLLPLLAVALSFTGWLRPVPDSFDLELTGEMREAAALQSGELEREAARLKELRSLSEEEGKELEDLGAQVDAMAEDLAKAEGLTAGELLESLEERARAAEKLAEKLGLSSNEWASPEMLEEMARHPDTADLSMFIKDKVAEGAAGEATRIQSVLADDGITSETQERHTLAMESIMGHATENDRGRPVGERIGNASRKLLDAQVKPAAREFEELAKHFQELAAREEAREKLEELAASLREAGGEISGSELRKMEEEAQTAASGEGSPEGLQSLDSGASPSAPGALPGIQELAIGESGTKQEQGQSQAQTGDASGEKVPVPGSEPGKGEGGDQNSKGEQTFSAPVPGEKPSGDQSGSGLGASDQSREGKDKGGMLSAPIPGMDPGQSAPGAGLALGNGASSQSGQGGDQAGTGTAELVDSPSELIKAKGDAEVIAQRGREGESSIRSVEGEVRAETTTRSKQEVLTEFLEVEEQALDEQSLPLSRKQQVLRYFSALRAQFEKTDSE